MDVFCRAESIDAGEPIAGTAVARTDVWLALEYDRPWGSKAVAQSDLSADVQRCLATWERQIAGARVQLIRGDARVTRPGTVTFFVGVSGVQRAAVVRLQLADHDALASVDVPAIVAGLRQGTPVVDAEPVSHPLVLVCTNGKRDRCCAKWGLPIYAALAQAPGIECWQTTHLGGHRFAPTLLTLPEGLCYGRLTLEDLPALVAATTAGLVFEPARTLRGRTCLSEAAQAAEVAWRVHSGEVRIAALTSADETEAPEAVAVELTDDRGGLHEVAMQRRTLPASTHPSCGKDPSPVRGWFVQPG